MLTEENPLHNSQLIIFAIIQLVIISWGLVTLLKSPLPYN